MNTKQVYERMLTLLKKRRKPTGLCSILIILSNNKKIGLASYLATKQDMARNGIIPLTYNFLDKQSRVEWLEKRIKELK